MLRDLVRRPRDHDDARHALLRELAYVPAHYETRTVGRAIAWSRDGSDAFIAPLVDDALRALERLLAYRLRRELHVVVYGSNEEACRALDRRVPPTMLMAPLHTHELALIALQSPSVDPRNGDRERMRRHLGHVQAHGVRFVFDSL